MLADAAKLTIDVQLILLEEAFTLTEASAFNIQFRDGRPVLTDVAAIARPQRLGAWMAHEEFDRQFLFPLLLAQHRGWDLSSYFLAHPNGMNAPRVAEALGAFTGWRPAVLRNVFVPALLGGRPKGLRDRDEAREEDPKFQASVLKRLRDEISALIGAPKVDAGRQVPATRTDALASILRELGVATVLDINTGSGAFALAAASAGARVCAIDADSRAIDSLYLKTQESQARITPLVVDIAFPSPATGFLNRDRASFLDRPFADAALLMDRWRELITAIGLPVQEIVTLLSRLTREWLIIESGPLSNNGALHFREFLGALDSVFAVGKDVSVSDPATHIIALRKRS
jgi:hypothetical protein